MWLADADPPQHSIDGVLTARSCLRLFWFSHVEGRTPGEPSTLDSRSDQIARRLIERFQDAACSHGDFLTQVPTRPARSHPKRMQRALEQLLYEGFLLPEMAPDPRGAELPGALVLRTWNALRGYAAALAPVLARNTRVLALDEVLARTFLERGLSLRNLVAREREPQRIQLRGRVDALWYDHLEDQVLLAHYQFAGPRTPAGALLSLSLRQWLLAMDRGVEARVLDVTPLDGDLDPAPALHPSARDLRACRDQMLHDDLLGSMVAATRWIPGESPPPSGPADPSLCSDCPVRAECFHRIGPDGENLVPLRAAQSRLPRLPGAPPLRDPDAVPIVVRLGRESGSRATIVWKPTALDSCEWPNLAIVGRSSGSRARHLEEILEQLARSEGNVGGSPPKILVLDCSGAHARGEFADSLQARVITAPRLPFNPLELPHGCKDDVHEFNPIARSIDTIVDSLGRAMNLGVMQQCRLRVEFLVAYNQHRLFQNDPTTWAYPAPTLADVVNIYCGRFNIRKDKLYSMLLGLGEAGLFAPDPGGSRRLWSLIDTVTILDLHHVSEDLQGLAIASALDQLFVELRRHGESGLGGPSERTRQLRFVVVLAGVDDFLRRRYPITEYLLHHGRRYGVACILSTRYLRHYTSIQARYDQVIPTWIAYPFEAMSDLQAQDAFGVIGRPGVRRVKDILSRCGSGRCLAVLRNEDAALTRLLELDSAQASTART